MIGDPHHDHQNGNMKAPTFITHHCPICYAEWDKHHRNCPQKTAAGPWQDVDGLEHGDFPDGVYMVRLSTGKRAVAYVNNDTDGGIDFVSLTYDNDTREIDPRDVVRIAWVDKE